MSAGDWAVFFGLIISIGQGIANRLKIRKHGKQRSQWEDESGAQMSRILLALRQCRESEKVLRKRLDTIEEFHGPGRCIPKGAERDIWPDNLW